MAIYTDYNTVTTTDVDVEAINNAIRNILLTKKGSLAGKPTFGSNIHLAVFNQLDYITESDLKIYISEALTQWETRILIDEISFDSQPEYNRVVALINYSYKDNGLLLNERLNVTISQ